MVTHPLVGAPIFPDAAPAIVVIDANTNTITADLPASVSGDIALTPDGQRAYVAGGSAVSVIDVANRAVLGTLSVTASSVAITPDGRFAYVTGCGPSGVCVIDTATNTVTGNIAVDSSGGIAITPNGTRAFVAGSAISVIALAANAVVTTMSGPRASP